MRAIEFIISAAFTLLVIAFLLRFILNWVRADMRNPVAQAILTATNPLVLPLRKVIPRWGSADLASLLAALAIELVSLLVLSRIRGPMPSLETLMLASLLGLIAMLLHLYFYSILIYALMSWFNPSPYHPVAHLLHSICEPVLQPLRRVIPPIGGLDLSALVALIGIQALLLLLVQ